MSTIGSIQYARPDTVAKVEALHAEIKHLLDLEKEVVLATQYSHLSDFWKSVVETNIDFLRHPPAYRKSWGSSSGQNVRLPGD